MLTFLGNRGLLHTSEAALSQLKGKRKELERIFQEYSLKTVPLQSRDQTLLIEQLLTPAIQDLINENSEKIRSSYERQIQEIRSTHSQEVVKYRTEIDRLNRHISDLQNQLKVRIFDEISLKIHVECSYNCFST